LGRLAETAGAVIVDTLIQVRRAIHSQHYLGSGKLNTLKILAEEQDADLVIFDDELSPSQQKLIEQELEGIKIIDRSALILDIFTLHARTREAKDTSYAGRSRIFTSKINKTMDSP